VEAEIEILKAFIPEPGFQLEAMLGTTYGLDSRVVLAIVGFTLEAIEGDIDMITLESAGRGRIQAALKENLRKVLFVRERGLNNPSRNPNEYEVLLMDQVCARWKRGKALGSQHAKLILAVFKSQAGKRYGRLYVGSKNLTFGTAKELGVVLELKENGADRNLEFSKDLNAFLKTGLAPELEGASAIKMRVFDTLVRAIAKYRLGIVTADVRFHWQARHLQNKKLWPVIQQELQWAKRVDLHSPWADPKLVAECAKGPGTVHLKCLKDPKYQYTADLSSVSIHFDGVPLAGEVPNQHSHAKAYRFSDLKRSSLYFGSANLTPSGIGLSRTHNTEILLEWKAGPKAWGELLCTGQTSPLDADPPFIEEQTAAELLQQELFGVTLVIEYSEANEEIRYRLENAPARKIRLTHRLIEPILQGGPRHFDVEISNDRDRVGTAPIVAGDIKKISSWIVLTAYIEGQEVTVDLNVDLPSVFYDARVKLQNLKSFRLDGHDLVQELLSIGDVTIPGGSDRRVSAGTAEDPDKRWLQWIDRIHLESYALRLYKLKLKDSSGFEQRANRLKQVITDLELSESRALNDIARALKEVHRVLIA
jgi:hypothetical protein